MVPFTLSPRSAAGNEFKAIHFNACSLTWVHPLHKGSTQKKMLTCEGGDEHYTGRERYWDWIGEIQRRSQRRMWLCSPTAWFDIYFIYQIRSLLFGFIIIIPHLLSCRCPLFCMGGEANHATTQEDAPPCFHLPSLPDPHHHQCSGCDAFRIP